MRRPQTSHQKSHLGLLCWLEHQEEWSYQHRRRPVCLSILDDQQYRGNTYHKRSQRSRLDPTVHTVEYSPSLFLDLHIITYIFPVEYRSLSRYRRPRVPLQPWFRVSRDTLLVKWVFKGSLGHTCSAEHQDFSLGPLLCDSLCCYNVYCAESNYVDEEETDVAVSNFVRTRGMNLEGKKQVPHTAICGKSCNRTQTQESRSQVRH